MGCFTGCIGLSSNSKRRNSARKILRRDKRICSYEPLHSSDPTDFSTIIDNTEKIPNSILRSEVDSEEEEKRKKGTEKTKKRVRFNLNVQVYEPILPTAFQNDCNDEGERSSDKKPEDLTVYPSNYRYHNCADSFEDEDEMGCEEESDLEDDEDYYTDDENIYEDDADDEDEDEEDQIVTPLLNPVENLAQWKAVKAKPLRIKQLMKENVEADTNDLEKPLLKDIFVNASLSIWISSPKSSSKRSPIVDITNMEIR